MEYVCGLLVLVLVLVFFFFSVFFFFRREKKLISTSPPFFFFWLSLAWVWPHIEVYFFFPPHPPRGSFPRGGVVGGFLLEIWEKKERNIEKGMRMKGGG